MLVHDVDSKLSASSDEAGLAGASGTVAPSELEVKVVVSFDSVEWVDSASQAFSEPNTPSEPEAYQEDVPVSVHSSSYRTAMTTLEATYLCMPRVILAARVGVWVLGGMHSESGSSSNEVSTIQRDGDTDMDCPLG